MADRNNETTTGYQGPDGRFAPGNPGRPKGSRHKVTKAVETLLEGQSEALTQKAVDMALAGDATAMRLCLERVAPAKKDGPVRFDLPSMGNAQEAADAAAAVLRAVAEGELTPLEGATVMGLIENYRRVLETSEFEKRIEALETNRAT